MWGKFVRMAMLNKQDHGRSQVAGSTQGISGQGSFLVKMVGFRVDK
jgi:hypothetical protein